MILKIKAYLLKIEAYLLKIKAYLLKIKAYTPYFGFSKMDKKSGFKTVFNITRHIKIEK